MEKAPNSVEVKVSEEDIEIIAMLIDEENRNESIKKQRDRHNNNNNNNNTNFIKENNSNNNFMDIENQPGKNSSNVFKKNNLNRNNYTNNKNRNLSSERENEVTLEPELIQMTLEEFDFSYNIANTLEGQMLPELNSYFFIVNVYENSYNEHRKNKTIFCISCLENNFYFNLINKRNPKDDFNNIIDISKKIIF